MPRALPGLFVSKSREGVLREAQGASTFVHNPAYVSYFLTYIGAYALSNFRTPESSTPDIQVLKAGSRFRTPESSTPDSGVRAARVSD